MPPPPKAQVAPPFASRELNGEVLLDELSELRAAQVHPIHLNDCVVALRELSRLRSSEAGQRIKHLATSRFAAQPAMASLLVRWAQRLRSDVDVPVLVGHFERIAMVGACLSALRRAAERLPKGGRG
jgi:hypothetical protein